MKLKTLCKILDQEDMESLKFADISAFDSETKEIINFIVENKTFDGTEILTKLSKSHFNKYIDLRNSFANSDFQDKLDKHIAEIQNLQDTTHKEQEYLKKTDHWENIKNDRIQM